MRGAARKGGPYRDSLYHNPCHPLANGSYIKGAEVFILTHAILSRTQQGRKGRPNRFAAARRIGLRMTPRDFPEKPKANEDNTATPFILSLLPASNYAIIVDEPR